MNERRDLKAVNPAVARVIAIASGLVLVVGLTLGLRVVGTDTTGAALIGGAVGFADYFLVYTMLTRRAQ